MKYSVQLDGFENQKIEVDSRGIFRNAIMFINGSPAPIMKKGEFILRRNDGAEVIAKLNQSFFHDAPSIQIEGTIVNKIEPLTWYQYLISSVPFIFVFCAEVLIFLAGTEYAFVRGWIPFVIIGLIAAFIGIEFVNANIRIFHSKMRQPLKYWAVLGISCALLALYIPMFALFFMLCCCCY